MPTSRYMKPVADDGSAIMSAAIDACRAHSDLVDLFSDLSQVRASGVGHVTICPFHKEKTPSCYIYGGDDPHFHCFGCKEHGDAIHFVRKTQQLEFWQAVDWLSNRYGFTVERDHAAQAHPYAQLYHMVKNWHQRAMAALRDDSRAADARAYLLSRSVDVALQQAGGVGWIPPDAHETWVQPHDLPTAIAADLVKVGEDGRMWTNGSGRIAFPLSERASKVVGFCYRDITGKAIKPYYNTGETPIFKKASTCYQPSGGVDPIHICEGPFDALAILAAGHAAVACCGTAVSRLLGRRIAQSHRGCTLVLDGDQAGQRGAVKAVMPLVGAGLMPGIITLPDDKDPGDFHADIPQLKRHLSVIGSWGALVLSDPALASRVQHDPIGVLEAVAPYVQAMPDPDRMVHMERWFEDAVRVERGTMGRVLQRLVEPAATEAPIANLTSADGTLLRLAAAHPWLATRPLPDGMDAGYVTLLSKIATAINRHQVLAVLADDPASAVLLSHHPDLARAIGAAIADDVIVGLDNASAVACWDQAVLRSEQRRKRAAHANV